MARKSKKETQTIKKDDVKKEVPAEVPKPKEKKTKYEEGSYLPRLVKDPATIRKNVMARKDIDKEQKENILKKIDVPLMVSPKEEKLTSPPGRHSLKDVNSGLRSNMEYQIEKIKNTDDLSDKEKEAMIEKVIADVEAVKAKLK